MQPTDHMSTAVEYSCGERDKQRGRPHHSGRLLGAFLCQPAAEIIQFTQTAFCGIWYLTIQTLHRCFLLTEMLPLQAKPCRPSPPSCCPFQLKFICFGSRRLVGPLCGLSPWLQAAVQVIGTTGSPQSECTASVGSRTLGPNQSLQSVVEQKRLEVHKNYLYQENLNFNKIIL